MTPLLLVISLSAQAAWYTPYAFQDAELKNRKDLKERPAMYVKGSVPEDFKTLHGAGTDVTFFTEVADVIENLMLKKGPDIEVEPEPNLCAEHDQFDLNNQSLTAEQVQIAQQSQSLCDRVNSPAEFVRTEFERTRPKAVRLLGQWKPGGVKPEELNMKHKLEDIIVVPGAQLLTVEWPEALLNDHTKKMIGVVIKKIFYRKLMAELKEQIDIIGDAVELRPLRRELSSARRYLVKLRKDGLAQAKADHQKVVAAGLCRPKLPYPSLTDEERKFLAMQLGGVWWRIRGGGVWSYPSGNDRRHDFNQLPLETIGEMLGGKLGKKLGTAQYIRNQKGYSRHMDHGHVNDDKWIDLKNMTTRGYFQAGFKEKFISSGLDYLFRFKGKPNPKKVLKKAGYDQGWTVAGSVQMGPCYFQTAEVLFPHTLAGKKIQFVPYGGWAEVCMGATVGIGMAKSLLTGHKCD